LGRVLILKLRRDPKRSKIDVDTITAQGKKAATFVQQMLLNEEYVLVEFDV